MAPALRISNNILGYLNMLSFVLSILVFATGIWLSRQGTTACERFLDVPLIIIGIFLMAVSLMGMIGSFYAVNCLLCSYVIVLYTLIAALSVFAVLAFVVTSKGAGEALSGKGYMEYRLGNYSNWLQKRVNNTKNWNKISSCLRDSKICDSLINDGTNTTVEQFFHNHLTAIQSGCCKPSNDCDFEYVKPTEWSRRRNSSSLNPDCKKWNSDPKVLCYGCDSCKAGFVENIRHDWKKVATFNILVIVFLFIIVSIACCALGNNANAM